MIKLQEIAPEAIEAESFRIISNEFTQQTGMSREEFSASEYKIVQRVIHATGDFTLASNIVFHNEPIEHGIEAVRSGGDIVVDVHMVASGISKKILSRFGGQVFCRVSDEQTISLAQKLGTTRSEAAMRGVVAEHQPAIVVVGNAPTGLLAVLKMVDAGVFSPKLIVGVPVGFVNAAESKMELLERQIPSITITGRRGGSPIAAAMVNAILRLA